MKHKKLRNLRSRTRRQVGLDITLFIFIVAIMLSVLSFNLALTGFFTAGHPAGGVEWENHVQITASSDQQNVTYHIVFGSNRPEICADGVRVETSDGQQVVFKTANEAYGGQGLCTETDVVFGNLIYQPPQAEQPPSGNFTITGALAAQQQQTITYDIYYGRIVAQAQPQPQTPVENLTIPKTEATNLTNFSLPAEQPIVPKGKIFGIQGGPWWDGSWLFRQNITVTNNVASALTTFQVNLTIDTASLIADGKMNSSCNDIRFVNSTNYSVDYWIESGCNTSTTKIWMEVPNIPSSGKENIMMYYGNSGAAAASNGNATFLFYDNFDVPSNALNQTLWPVNGTGTGAPNPGTIKVANSNLNETSGCAGGSTCYASVTSLNFTSSSFVVERKLQIGNEYIGDCLDRDRFGLRGVTFSTTDQGIFSSGVCTTDTVFWSADTGIVVPFNTDLRMVQKVNTTNYTWTINYYGNNSNIYNNVCGVTLSSPYGATSSVGNRDGSIRTDWVIARNYAATEPTVSIAAEEYAFTPTQTNPILNSTSGNNLTTDNLTCYNQTTYSPAGRGITNTYNWYKNGLPVMLLNMPFETNTNSTATGAILDYSGNNNKGTLGNGTASYAPKWTSAGKVGGAYNFDGDNDFMNISSITYTNFTWAVWVKTNNASDTSQYVGGRATTMFFRIGTGCAAGAVDYGVYNNSGQWTELCGNNVLASNTWYLVVVAFNSSNMLIYVNGTLDSSRAFPGTAPSSGEVVLGTLGWSKGASGYSWNGTLDNLRIYNYALSSAQIAQLYQNTKDGYSSSETIVSGQTSVGDNWTCQVTPSDSIADGITLNSSNLTIIPSTNISSCQNLTMANKIYNLTSNFTGNQSTGRCIDIQASNMTLDCGGWNLTGKYGGTTYGIYVGSYNNATIKNCIVTNYTNGIYLTSSSNDTLTNNTVNNNTNAGFSIQSSSNNNNLTGNTANNNTNYGIYVYSSNSTLTSNIANNNSYGITLDTYNNNILTSNTANNNTNYGIYITSSSSNNITNNTANNNAGGIYLFFNTNNKLTSNTANNNNYGISFVNDADSNNLTNNTASYNTIYDIYSVISSGNIITNLTTNDTTSNITYSGDIYLKSATGTGKADPLGYTNISHYLNITNGTSGAWIYINISYKDADIPSSITNTSTLQILKYSSSKWWSAAYVGTPDSVDTTNKYVYANITNFSGVYAPMGITPGGNVSGCQSILAYGVYNLTSNLTGISDSSCLNITASNVTLDCKGYSISANASGQGYGIYASGVSNATIKNCNIKDYNQSQIYLNNAGGTNLIQNNTLYNASYAPLRGIWLAGTTANTTVTNNTVYSSSLYDIQLDASGTGNVMQNTIIGSAYPTNTNLTYAGSVGIKGVASPNADPVGFRNISKYVNVTNLSANTWALLNISYTDANAAGLINKSTLRMSKYNATAPNWYTDPSAFASSSGNDSTNDYVWANITNFGSLFAPMGQVVVNISACQTLSTTNIIYGLNQSIAGQDGANSWCLRASANGITIDCQGFNVSANASGMSQLYGIYAGAGTANITVRNCNVFDFATAQIAFVSVTGVNNTMQNNTAYQFNNFSGNQVTQYGLYLSGTTANTTIINNTVRNASTADLFLGASGIGNVVKDTIVDGPYSAKINLTWGPSATANINVKAATSPAPADPTNFTNIGRYVAVTNSTNAWAFLNISYTDTDAISVSKSSLRMSKNNGSWYTDPTTFASSSGNDSINDYVYANITNFGSTFAPLGVINLNVTNCRNLTFANYTYTLTNNLTGNQSNGICVNVQANNVTLNCAGYSINGTDAGTTYGVYVSTYNSTTIKNCTTNNYTYGIYLSSSSNDIFTNDNATLINPSGDFYSTGTSKNNTITNFTTNDTTSSFTYSGSVAIKAATGSSKPDPAGYTNISHYISITASSSPWLFINISYKDADVPASLLNTSTITLWKYTSSQWWNGGFVGTPDGINTAAKYVYANITNFSGVYAPMGITPGGNVSGCQPIPVYGTFNLTSNLTGISDSSCLNITASNVVLDCMGYSISSNTTGQNYGIYDSGVANVTIKNCNIKDYNQSQIYLNNAGGTNTIQNCTLSNSTNTIQNGIWLAGTTANTTITNDTVYGGSLYDIQLAASGSNNNVTNTVIGSVNATSINLTYAGSVGVKAASFPAAPTDYRLLGRTVDVTNLSANTWASLNVAYLTSDIPADVIEGGVRMAKNNGSWSTDPSTFSNSYGIDNVNHVVYANITNFGSQFGPLGVSQNVSICRALDAQGTYNLTTNLSGVGPNCGGHPCCISMFGNSVLDCKGFSITANGAGQTYGVYANTAGVTVQNCSVVDYDWAQIYFNAVMASTIQNSNFHNSSRAIQRGIWLTGNSGSVTITNDNVYSAALYDIQLDPYSPAMSNVIRNTVVGNVYPTTINMDYGPDTTGQIGIFGVTAPRPDNAGTRNISAYVDIVNTSGAAGTWALLNISYTDGQAWGTDDYDPNFQIYRSSGGGPWQSWGYWADSPPVADPINNYVYVNITHFGSQTGIFGGPGGTLGACPGYNNPLNMSGYWHLNQSIIGALDDPCVWIKSSDVIFDGQGHTISAGFYFVYPNYGIEANFNNGSVMTNVTVKNITVTTFNYDQIFFDYVNSSLITNTNLSYLHNSPIGSRNGGIEVWYANTTNITNNSLDNNATIYLDNVNDNVVRNNTVTGPSVSGQVNCVFLQSDSIGGSNRNTIANNNLTNCGSGAYIYSYAGSGFAHPNFNNTVANNTINNCANCTGITIFGDVNSTNITNNTIVNSTSNNVYGAGISFSDIYNSLNITDNNIRSNHWGIESVGTKYNSINIVNNTLYNNTYDFEQGISLNAASAGNITAINNTIGTTYPTKISFKFGGGVMDISGLGSPPSDPSLSKNIGKYVNATSSGLNWLALNVSYLDSDLGFLNESNLAMAKNNGSWYTNPSTFSNSYGVDTVNNYVYANITNFGSTFGPLGPGCSNISQSNTIYNLTADLVGNSTGGICIKVLASNITLDCAGHSITGNTTVGIGNTPEYGIYLQNSYSNNIIKNCIISNYSQGIYIQTQSNNNTIINTTAKHTHIGVIEGTAAGIHIKSSSSNNTVVNSTIYNGPYQQYGILIDSPNALYNNITNNTIYNTSYGINASSDHNSFVNNTVFNNSLYGMYIISSYNNITNNTAYNNLQMGIFANGSSNSIAKNIAYNNSGSGIGAQGVGVNITNNTCYNNTPDAIHVGPPAGGFTGIISSNTVYNNSGFGIYLSGSTSSQLGNNAVYNNTGDGIYVSLLSLNNVVANNTIYSNNASAIRIDGSNSTTITNNTCYNNRYGISLDGTIVAGIKSDNITNNTFYNNTQYGIYIAGTAATQNNFTNINSTGNGLWDFYVTSSSGSSPNNIITNLTTNDTTSSFTYAGDVYLKSANGTGKTDPTGYANISHYLNITNATAAWIYLNVSYKNSDVPSSIADQSTLQIWKYSSSQWWNSTYVGSPDSADITNKYVYANITNFSSIYAPLGYMGIVNCANLTVANSVYNLTGNLSGNQTGRPMCIDVQVDNVILDCKGYSINGTTAGTTYGVYASARNNVTIKNCIVQNYSSGIYIVNTGNSVVVNNTANNNTQYGIQDYISNGYNIITNNTAYSNAKYGIFVSSGYCDNLTGNILNNNTQYGAYIGSSINITFINNTANSNSQVGIGQDQTYNGIFTNNTANSNANYGIIMARGNSNNLTNNTANNNGQYGIYCWISHNNTITNNTANNNTQYGIYLSPSSNDTLTSNNASLNSIWDFASEGSANNTITNLTTNDTTSSLTYSGDVYLKSASGTGLTDPGGYTNISHYLNITSSSGNWMYINISYKAADVPASITNTSTLQIWKYSSSQWWTSAYVGSPDSVDTTNKFVYANITNFSSIYAPLGYTGVINNCVNLTSANTVYNLTANLTGNQSNGICVDVQTTNVTLDCKGYSINGTYAGTTYGIYDGGWSNLTVKNCNVQSYYDGISLITNYSTINNNVVYGNNYFGIEISGRNNNITNNKASLNYNGISMRGSNNTLINNTANSGTAGTMSGIYLNTVDNSTITNNTANSNINLAGTASGIQIESSGANGTNTFTNNTASSNNYGIFTDYSANSTLINNNASYNTIWDFSAFLDAFSNITIINLTTNDTTSSFTYRGNISLKSATGTGKTDPAKYTNISHYLNITNTYFSSGSANDWIFLNVSYNDADVPAAIWNTSTLKIWKYSSSQWWNSTYVGTSDTKDPTHNYVYANITNFSSIYAPLGGTNHAPNAPTLFSPADGSMNNYNRTPYLNWTIPTDADSDTLHFQVQVANDSGFSQLVVNASSANDTTGFSPTPPVAQGVGNESYHVQSNLVLDKQYFWRVRAYDGYDWGSWSTTFSFNVSSLLGCPFGINITSFGSGVTPGTSVNGTLNYAGTGSGTLYNVSNTGNVNENMTQSGTNMSCISAGCPGDYIDVSNISWKSSTTSANDTSMIYANGIKMTAAYDTANPVASYLPPTNVAWYRQWLTSRSKQGGGTYNGTYTQKCEQA